MWVCTMQAVLLLEGQPTLNNDVQLQWWTENWWINFESTLSVAGRYVMQVFSYHIDGSMEPLRFRTANG